MERIAANGDRQLTDFSYAIQDGSLASFASDGRAYLGTPFNFASSPVPLNQFAGAWTSGDHFIRLLPTTYQGNSHPDILRLCVQFSTPTILRLSCTHHRSSDNEPVALEVLDDVGGVVTAYFGAR